MYLESVDIEPRHENMSTKLTCTLTSSDSAGNLLNLIGKNVELREIPYTMERAVNSVTGETRMLPRYKTVTPKEEPIKTRTAKNAIGELELED